MWFRIAMPAAFFAARLLGIRYGTRAPSPAAVADAAPRSNQRLGEQAVDRCAREAADEAAHLVRRPETSG